MSRGLGAAVLAIVLASGLAWWTAREFAAPVPAPKPAAAPGPPPVAAPAPPLPTSPELDAVAELREQLAAEVEARRELTRELAQLRAGLDALLDERAQAGDETARRPSPGARRFDSDALAASGLAQTEIEELRERFEQSRLDSLYLRDQAVREGWQDDSRYLVALVAARQQLREEIGPERFDWLEYASGSTNRVRVRDVIGGSEADRAGIEPGDLLYSYAGRRIFSAGDVRWLTATGEAGEQIMVEVERGDRTRRMRVARGPLGVYLEGMRVMPSALR